MISEILDWLIPVLDSVPAVRGILAFILMFFLPGFCWIKLLFGDNRKMTVIETVALSFGLSIAMVALSLLVVYVFFNVSITSKNALLVILVIIIIPTTLYGLRRIVRKYKAEFPRST